MDLLEALDDLSSQRRTFKKHIDVDIPIVEEVPSQDASQHDPSLLGFNVVDGFLDDKLFGMSQSSQNSTTQLVSEAYLSDASKMDHLLADDIIKNVRRRLNGDEAAAETETQIVEEPQEADVTQKILKTQKIVKTQLSGARTQLNTQVTTQLTTQYTQKPNTTMPMTTQMDAVSDGNESEHHSGAQSDLEAGISSSFVPDKAKRAQKIAERAAAKALLREQLEAEKRRTALEATEFDELENSVIVSSERSKKDEAILAETRRLQGQVEFIPLPAKNKKFDKNRLFAAFGYTETNDATSPELDSWSSPVKKDARGTSSPLTSPMANSHSSPVKTKQDSNEFAAKANANAATPRRALNNPLKSYEERLNDNTRVNKKGFKIIDLDSDPEVDRIDSLKQLTSKETRLDIKTKFVRKKKIQCGTSSSLASLNLNKYFPQLPHRKVARNFIASLNSTATRQLREVIEAKKLEKEELRVLQNLGGEQDGEHKLSIEDLLEREIERNIRLRRKENRKKERETIGSSDDESGADNSEGESFDESEQESDVDAVDNVDTVDAEVQVQSSFVEPDGTDIQMQDQDSDDENQFAKPLKKRKAAVLSDDEDDATSKQDSVRSTQNQDASFMYGAFNEDDNEDSNDFQLGSYGTQQDSHPKQPNLKQMFGISMSQAFESTLPAAPEGGNLMSAMRNKQMQMIGEDESFDDHNAEISKDSFLVVEEDETVLPDGDTKTQAFNESTQAINAAQSSHSKPQKRRLVQKIDSVQADAQSESESESESDEETRKINYAIAKEKQRQKDIRRKRKLKEWKRKGVTAIVDDEASESEDEFKGLGGADGDLSDEENSEDEKMLDDTSKIDLKANELRSKFAQEEQKRDEDDVKKLFEDIKTGRLRRSRKGAGDSLDIELSDDDDDLKNYYMSRVKNQRNRLLENEKIASIAANDRSRLFFETIAEKPVMFQLDNEVEEMEVEVEAEKETTSDPFVDSAQANPPVKKRKLRISHDYISKTISEACDTSSAAFDEDQAKLFAKYQHGLTDEIEDEIDLALLKKNSSIVMSIAESVTATQTIEVDTASVNVVDSDDETFNPMKRSTLVKSFQRYNPTNSGNSVKEVSVTVSKAYKNSVGNKASIGYLANKNNSGLLKGGRTLKARNIEKSLRHGDSATSSLKGVFNSGNFN